MADPSQNFSMEQNDELRSTKESTKMAELQNLIQQDLQLSPDIRLADNITPAKKYSDVETVLLIGVTGMLGPYILRDLCELPKIKKIYCLIRKIGEELPLDRLQERLDSTGVIEEVDFSKIICVNGDICNGNLGFSFEKYETLSENIDAVIHFGIQADYTGEYSREPGKDGIRTVNIIGTTNVLKFVVNKTLKCLFLASSLFCSITSLASTRLSEDWQDPEAFEGFNNGYRISKVISEELCKQAIELGVPVKVFRFGFIGGDSTVGRSDYTWNQYSLLWLSVLKLGYIPNLPIPAPILPVDVYSKLSIDLFFNPEAPSDVYNICRKGNVQVNKAVVDISKEFGFKVKPVSVRKFFEKVEKYENLPMETLQEFYFSQKDTVFKDLFNGRLYKGLVKVLKEVDVIFENSKTAKYIPNINDVDDTEESLRKDLKFLKDTGAFEKYGVTSAILK